MVHGDVAPELGCWQVLLDKLFDFWQTKFVISRNSHLSLANKRIDLHVTIRVIDTGDIEDVMELKSLVIEKFDLSCPWVFGFFDVRAAPS